jgi:hypothetical protein
MNQNNPIVVYTQSLRFKRSTRPKKTEVKVRLAPLNTLKRKEMLSRILQSLRDNRVSTLCFRPCFTMQDIKPADRHPSALGRKLFNTPCNDGNGEPHPRSLSPQPRCLSRHHPGSPGIGPGYRFQLLGQKCRCYCNQWVEGVPSAR